jgi:hypothetical protein
LAAEASTDAAASTRILSEINRPWISITRGHLDDRSGSELIQIDFINAGPMPAVDVKIGVVVAGVHRDPIFVDFIVTPGVLTQGQSKLSLMSRSRIGSPTMLSSAYLTLTALKGASPPHTPTSSLEQRTKGVVTILSKGW